MTVVAANHVLLTRFNLPSQGHESVIRAQDGWLRNRVELFQTFCLPSVLAQTSKNFRWLIYFDPESPTWLKERIDRWNCFEVIRPVMRAAVSRQELVGDIRDLIGERRDRLITTNVDNDDGLAVNFVERLQQVYSGKPRAAVYLATGIIKNGGRVYCRTDKRNAFCSVQEDWDQPVTCWAAYHNMLGLSMPEIVLHGDPAWLQVIHGANVSNRVRGRLCSPAAYNELFPGMLSEVPIPTVLDYANDLAVQTPKRLVIEGIRKTAKELISLTFGLQGLDRAKMFATTFTQKIGGLAKRSLGDTTKKN